MQPNAASGGVRRDLVQWSRSTWGVAMENTENWCFAWFDGVAGSDRQAISRKSVWTSGSVITVGVLDGDPALRTKVEAVAQEWLQRAVTTLSFDFHSGLEVPAVRISFKHAGQWSMIGKTCL